MPRKSQQEETKKLAEQLGRRRASAWEELPETIRARVWEMGEEYKGFLKEAKTEREAVRTLVDLAEKNGFQRLEKFSKPAPGKGFYEINRGKSLLLGKWGQKPPAGGMRLVGAHLDSPRLDLKPAPILEEAGLALFKTHYYGGIKKYQWTALPLALHGTLIKGDGEKIEFRLGEDPEDPVFTITDLLPHLAKDQLKKNLGEAIEGESLNLLVAGIPYHDREAKERVKLALLDLLHRQYGLVEEDFVSAELEVVPAAPARDVGFDRSMVGAYGQDDRVCAFAAVQALLEAKQPANLAILLLMDKEEIGSMGNTGMQSRFLEGVAKRLLRISGAPGEDALEGFFNLSEALSADVNAALDPSHQEVMDKLNAARLGGGVVLTKYTGSGGKYNSSDASAEFVGKIRRLFNSHRIVWQTGELGKVDQGGGGTIAMYLANYGMEVLDCGVPVLSMHSPLEVTSKADLWMTYRAYAAFLEE